jgi:hypothetical protein
MAIFGGIAYRRRLGRDRRRCRCIGTLPNLRQNRFGTTVAHANNCRAVFINNTFDFHHLSGKSRRVRWLA